MDRSLLDLLVCPRTHQPLDLLDAQGIARVNAAIAGDGLARGDGSAQSEPLRQALVTRDRACVYRIDDGIPVLLADEALDTRALGLS